jgi:transposase
LLRAREAIGISVRTIQRWRNRPDGEDGRCGPHRRPHNALRPAEEARIVSVLASSRYADLSPKQLVPRLADEGLYLASESTLYRVQRRYGLRGAKRRTLRSHVTRSAALHRAAGPNQVWSWDISWLPTTVRAPGTSSQCAGPGVPDPPKELAMPSRSESRQRLEAGVLVLANRCWEACITSIRSQPRRRARNGLTAKSLKAANVSFC